MKSAKVVIGCGFGDEGKGLITDFLCDRKYGTVVRFNGGAQAGHTVVDPVYGRHVFHHFGSGTMRGYTTHLSRHFITNPMMAMDEMKALAKIGCGRALTADPNGMVTTIYDMMINQMVEEARGGKRHGSCGLGINETIKRHEGSDLHTRVYELRDGPKMALKMARIRAEWLPARLDALGITMTTEWAERVKNDAHILRAVTIYEEYASAYLVQINDTRVFDSAFFPDTNGIVFEGAQGLLLDEDHYFFPHVTHSHTGIWNVLDVAREAGIDHLNVTYVTRAYATRHGAGPFPDEVSTMRFEDPTNVPNEWQGTLRFGLLNLDLLFESINNDLFRARDEHTIRVIPDIALTCMDQVGDTVRVVVNKQEMAVTPDHLISLVEEYTGLPVRYVSRGPTRNTIEVRRLHAAAA